MTITGSTIPLPRVHSGVLDTHNKGHGSPCPLLCPEACAPSSHAQAIIMVVGRQAVEDRSTIHRPVSTFHRLMVQCAPFEGCRSGGAGPWQMHSRNESHVTSQSLPH